MPDIFDEVAEELRTERIGRFLGRYGWALVVAAVAIVIAVGVWRWHEGQLAHGDQTAATDYLMASNAAADTGPNAAKAHTAALATLDSLATHAPAGYQTLATLRAAALLAEDGKDAQAAALYQRVAADQSADPLLRDLATILGARREIETGNPQLLKARLEPLAVAGNPWRPLALQEIALIDIREHRTRDARAILQRLATDAGTPPAVRDTAALLLERLES